MELAEQHHAARAQHVMVWDAAAECGGIGRGGGGRAGGAEAGDGGGAATAARRGDATAGDDGGTNRGGGECDGADGSASDGDAAAKPGGDAATAAQGSARATAGHTRGDAQRRHSGDAHHNARTMRDDAADDTDGTDAQGGRARAWDEDGEEGAAATRTATVPTVGANEAGAGVRHETALMSIERRLPRG